MSEITTSDKFGVKFVLKDDESSNKVLRIKLGKEIIGLYKEEVKELIAVLETALSKME